MSRRETTIRCVLPNLRYRWPQLKDVPDTKLAELYEFFAMSEDHGSNDAKFPEWVKDELGIQLPD